MQLLHLPLFFPCTFAHLAPLRQNCRFHVDSSLGMGIGDASPTAWLNVGCKSAFIREIRVLIVSILPARLPADWLPIVVNTQACGAAGPEMTSAASSPPVSMVSPCPGKIKSGAAARSLAMLGANCPQFCA